MTPPDPKPIDTQALRERWSFGIVEGHGYLYDATKPEGHLIVAHVEGNGFDSVLALLADREAQEKRIASLREDVAISEARRIQAQTDASDAEDRAEDAEQRFSGAERIIDAAREVADVSWEQPYPNVVTLVELRAAIISFDADRRTHADCEMVKDCRAYDDAVDAKFPARLRTEGEK